MIRLPKIKTAELSTYGNFAKCHQALFRVPREGLGTRLMYTLVADKLATLFADKLETVVRRRGSETNCIRQLERKLAQIMQDLQP